MIQLSKYLACNLNSKHIRVNSVSPGAFPNLKNKNKKISSKLKAEFRWEGLGCQLRLPNQLFFFYQMTLLTLQEVI